VFLHAARAVLLPVLALISSGDDCNLMRLCFPFYWASVPVGSLPLDDDNTDYLRARTQSARQGRAPQGDDEPVTPTLPETALNVEFSSISNPPNSPRPDAGAGEPCTIILVIPLRC
jgi:hypothetical protein